MIESRGMYIRNTACIPSNWKDIRITDMKELGKIQTKECDLSND
ncbi:MAG: hypothetical protein ACTSPQ_20835 [Candidatus Helarchaeota archaeon]